MDLPAWREENLAKRPEENDKKLRMSLVQIEEREKSLKNFWKVRLNKSNSVFKKLDSQFLINRKSVSIDRNRQRLTKKKFLNQFRLIEKKSQSIEILEKSQFWKKAQFLHKILQALKDMSQIHEHEMQSFSKTQVLNPFFPRLIFSNILHNFSSIKSILHKNSNYLQTWLVKPKTHTITYTMFSKK